MSSHNVSIDNNSVVFLNSKDYDTNSINGIKVLSMIWVIVMHSYSFATWWLKFTDETTVKNLFRPWYIQFIANGSFSIDNFLFMSGFLVVISYNKW